MPDDGLDALKSRAAGAFGLKAVFWGFRLGRFFLRLPCAREFARLGRLGFWISGFGFRFGSRVFVGCGVRSFGPSAKKAREFGLADFSPLRKAVERSALGGLWATMGL